MIMYEDLVSNNAFMAALFTAPATPAEQVRGFGATEAEAMQDAVEVRKSVTWDVEDGATWQEIAADAKNAAILTFKRTRHGVLVLDEN